jgi:hypothetical protein
VDEACNNAKNYMLTPTPPFKLTNFVKEEEHGGVHKTTMKEILQHINLPYQPLFSPTYMPLLSSCLPFSMCPFLLKKELC